MCAVRARALRAAVEDDQAEEAEAAEAEAAEVEWDGLGGIARMGGGGATDILEWSIE